MKNRTLEHITDALIEMLKMICNGDDETHYKLNWYMDVVRKLHDAIKTIDIEWYEFIAINTNSYKDELSTLIECKAQGLI